MTRASRSTSSPTWPKGSIAAGSSTGRRTPSRWSSSGRTSTARSVPDERTVILKMHGAVDRANPDATWDSYVITEDHYIEYLARTDIANLVPVTLAAKLRRSHFLFLGYSMRDWNLRVILHRIWGEQKLKYKSWAIQLAPVRARSRVLGAARRRRPRRAARRLRRGARRRSGCAARGRSRRDRSRGAVRGVPVQGARALRGGGCAVLLRPRRRCRARRRERARRPAHAPLRRERRRQELAPARRRRAAPARARDDLVLVLFADWRGDAAGVARGGAAGGERPRVRGPCRCRLAATIAACAEHSGRDLVVVLDQFEEYFVYHPDEHGEDTFALEFPPRGHAGRSARLVPDRDPRGRARAARALQGPHPRPLRDVPAPRPPRPRRGARGDRRAARAARRPRPGDAVVGRACARRAASSTRSKSAASRSEAPAKALLDGAAQPAAGLALDRGAVPPARAARASGTRSAERARGSLRLETLERLGGAERIVRTHLDDALDASTPTSRRSQRRCSATS